MTSAKIKFRKSTIKNKEGVLYFQLIHNRKAKLITTRFHLQPHEWDFKMCCVICGHIMKKKVFLYGKCMREKKCIVLEFLWKRICLKSQNFFREL